MRSLSRNSIAVSILRSRTSAGPMGLMAVAVWSLSASSWAATVNGKVIGPDGRPVAGAQVFTTAPQPTVSAKTNASGGFSFTWTSGSPTAKTYGHALAYKRGFSLGGALLKNGNTVIRLGHSATVEGQVNNTNEDEVAGATIKPVKILFRSATTRTDAAFITIPPQLARQLTARTDEEGTWHLQSLPPTGQAVLMLQDSRYHPTYIQVKLRPKTTAPSIVARASTMITGRVVNETGKPLAGIEIRAAGYGGRNGYQSVETETKADGTYQLIGLDKGTVTVSGRDSKEQRIAPVIRKVKIKSGAATTGINFKFTPGAVVEGIVIDKATKAPLAKAYVRASGVNQADIPPSTTNAKGYFRIRAIPGKLNVRVERVPPAYLRVIAFRSLTLAEGQTTRINLELQKGLTISGTTVDVQGKPAAGVRLYVQPDYRRPGARIITSSQMVTSDAKGKWRARGLQPGGAILSIEGTENAWELEGPKEINLPNATPIKVTVRRIPILPLQGRVITRTGQPLPKVNLNLNISVPYPENGYYSQIESCQSDKSGLVKVAKLRMRGGAKVSVITAVQGYHYVRGGEVKLTGNRYEMSDLVLAPLNMQARGVVKNATGQPVAGAQVLCLHGQTATEATTDANGRFVLKSLPDVPVTIMAAHRKSLAQVAEANPRQPLEIALQPVKALPEPDVKRGYEIMGKLFEAGPRGFYESDPQVYAALKELWPGTPSGRYSRYVIPQSLVTVDPDLALRLVNEHGGLFPEQMVAIIMMTLSYSNPARAAEWAPDKLDQLGDGFESYYAKMLLANAIVQVKPVFARDLYSQLSQQKVTPPGDQGGDSEAAFTAMRNAQLALLASRLNLPEAQSLRANAVANLKLLNAAFRPNVISTLLLANPGNAQKLLAEVSARERTRTIADAMRQVSPHDAKTLQQLVKLLRPANSKTKSNANRNGEASYYMQFAVQRLVRALGPTQPALALSLTRQLAPPQQKAASLVAVAQYQPKLVALRLLREVEKMPGASRNLPMGSWFIAQAYRLDPAWGTKLFAKYKATLQQQRGRQYYDNNFYGGYNGTSELAAFAYYYSQIDPAESRLMLEKEFSRQLQQLKRGQDNYSASQTVADIVTAMAALDVDRAFAMAALLQPEDATAMRRFGFSQSPQFQALSQIAEYMIIPESVRRTRPFKQWSSREYF